MDSRGAPTAKGSLTAACVHLAFFVTVGEISLCWRGLEGRGLSECASVSVSKSVPASPVDICGCECAGGWGACLCIVSSSCCTHPHCHCAPLNRDVCLNPWHPAASMVAIATLASSPWLQYAQTQLCTCRYPVSLRQGLPSEYVICSCLCHCCVQHGNCTDHMQMRGCTVCDK